MQTYGNIHALFGFYIMSDINTQPYIMYIQFTLATHVHVYLLIYLVILPPLCLFNAFILLDKT